MIKKELILKALCIKYMYSSWNIWILIWIESKKYFKNLNKLKVNKSNEKTNNNNNKTFILSILDCTLNGSLEIICKVINKSSSHFHYGINL